MAKHIVQSLSSPSSLTILVFFRNKQYSEFPTRAPYNVAVT